MVEEGSFTIELEQLEGYQFKVKFDWPDVPDLVVDEPAPMGRNAGPNAARLLAAAVGNCLSASLLFCMRKFKQQPGGLTASVTGALIRNEHGRIRVGGFNVAIRLADAQANIAHLDRCIAQFEDFCVVTDSVRHGIPVAVQVVDGAGTIVFQSNETDSSAETAHKLN